MRYCHTRASGKDDLGNWTGFLTKANGTTTLDQSRQHNLANEIAGNSGNPITQTTGPSWAQPSYDDNGNQTAGPHPGDETSKNSYVYDAWNRLVKVKNSTGSTIASYEYNALGWRVSKTLGPASNENGAVYNFYYNTNWQVVQINKNPAASAAYVYKQYIWSLRYIDAPICRFRDTNADGTLDETLYYAEDANFNVTALVNTSGSVVERYTYSAYGKVSIYSANWTSRTSSSYDNVILFAGYRWDLESGLYQVRHRMYNPSLGRWMQRDPMGYVVGLNLYVYVMSQPISKLDPKGLSDIAIGIDIDLVGGAGVDIGFGIVIDTDNLLGSGVYGTGGIAGGASVGVALQVTVVPAGNIEGNSIQLDANLSKISASLGATTGPNPRPTVGVGYGVGIGFSGSKTTTKSYSVADAIADVISAAITASELPGDFIRGVCNLF